MSFCSNKIKNFEFPDEEINKVRHSCGLLSMEIELGLKCNFSCPYCYVNSETSLKNELTLDEIKNTVLQAKDLGAKKIILLGGEPTLYPHYREVIRFLREHELEIEMFTNGSRITEEAAEMLFQHEVRVVLKMNTFDEELQDKLSGIKGAYKIIHTAFNNLKKAGYPSEKSEMAISTVICKQNLHELEKLWQWSRDQNILPYFEMITPQENAKQNEWLFVEPDEVHGLFQRLSDIDREKYGNTWFPQPPLVGNSCLRHQFSCLVNSQGDVMPCVGVAISVGNIRKNKLADIIKESEVIRNLRNYGEFLKGPCRSCEKAEYCYGCRGTAFQLTGDYLSSDPLCWKNYKQDKPLKKIS